jgi:hemolysin activation/secretion protein
MKPNTGFKVHALQFKLTGITVYSESELLALIADQVGKELDFEGLNQVADTVAAYYRKNGYFLAQAYLPAQEIKNGEVEITVLEGRVGEVKLTVKEGTRLRESRAQDILSGIQPGDLVNEKSLERSLLLLNDTPGAVVKSTLEPGAKVGTADTVVDLSDDGKLVSGSVDLDNWGSRFTGEYRLGGTVNINNPTGFGDLLSIRGQTSDTSGSPLGRLSYVVPVGSSGTKVGVVYSKLNYTLGKNFAALQAHGTATVASAYVMHPFIRSRNLNVFALAGLDDKSLQDRADATLFRDDKKLSMYKLGLSGDLRDSLMGGGLNSFAITASGGNANISVPAVLALDQSVNGHRTAGTFSKLNYEFQRVQALVGSTSLYLAVSGQAASKNLVSAEKFSVGGPSGVRAYPVGEAAADEGAIVTAEVRWNMPDTDFMFSGFVDSATAKLNRNPLVTDVVNTRNIWGYGLGMNMGKQGDYIVRTSIAWRGNNNMPVADIDRKPRAWMQLSKSF